MEDVFEKLVSPNSGESFEDYKARMVAEHGTANGVIYYAKLKYYSEKNL